MYKICSSCGYATKHLKSVHNHNVREHQRRINVPLGYITTCLNCHFTHSNGSVVKIHTELAHGALVKLFIININNKHQTLAEAIQEERQEQLFVNSIVKLCTTV